MKYFACAALFAASISIIPSAADATVTLDISQVGSDVVGSSSGSLNLTGLTEYEKASALAGELNAAAALAEVGDGGQWVDGFTGLTSYPTSLGPGTGTIFSSSVTGDPFAVYGAFGMVWLPDGYVSGSPIAGTATWLNQTIASLGLTPGTYTFVAPSDTVVVTIEGTAGAIPEPATWAMMLLGLCGIGIAMRSRGRSLFGDSLPNCASA
jgi:hypothetical protein